MTTRIPQPRDPIIRDLVRAARNAELSRRRMLSTVGLGGAAAAFLAACAPPTPPTSGATLALPKDVSDTEKLVRWSNWTAYLDQDDAGKTYPTLDEFIKKSGIKATYTEDIDDNDSYVSKVKPQLQAKQDIGADIITLTDWMANRLIREQLIQPLDLMQLPNVVSQMRPALKEVSFDPGRTHSVTWQSGFAGIGYNKAKVGRELKTIDDLWAPDLKGRVVVLSEFRDTVGLIMQSQGVNINGDFTADQVKKAMDVVSAKIADNSIRRVKGNAYLQDLKSGNAIAGIVWSGDLFVLQAETNDPNWVFAIPESGGTLWSDNMMVPITSTHRSNAQTLIDYYYEPEVAAQVAAYVNYVSPCIGAKEALAKSDPELADSPFIFPSDDYITQHNIQGFRALSATEDQQYSDEWAKVVGN